MKSKPIELPDPAGHSPYRRPRSIRRTASIDATWSEGRDSNLSLVGTARDVFSRNPLVAPTTIALDRIHASLSPYGREVLSIRSQPFRKCLNELVGKRSIDQLRATLRKIAPAGQFDSTPLYLLIDDITGISVIADWAWSRWPESRTRIDQARRERRLISKAGVCIGLREGSSSQKCGGDYQDSMAAVVASLPHPEDVDGWHELPAIQEPSMRRARRIDVWMDNDISVDAAFQDSATNPEGGRTSVHEYTLRATIDAKTHEIKDVFAVPHVLPFSECPEAADNLRLLIGVPASELRHIVGERLGKVMGCTHLNDALRALADVPVLAEMINSFEE